MCPGQIMGFLERAKGFEPSTPTLASLGRPFVGDRGRSGHPAFSMSCVGVCSPAFVTERGQPGKSGTPRGPQKVRMPTARPLTDTQLRSLKATGERYELAD